VNKIYSIHGGVHPPENKHQSTQGPIASIPLANQYIIPLNQHIGAPAEPLVDVGDHVLKGQPLARAQGVFSAPTHAPTSGIVVAIEPRPVASPSGQNSLCVVINADGQDTWIELLPCENYSQLAHHELVEKIRNAGIIGMGGAGFPTAVKLNPKSDPPIKTLILNGTECEPYITADDMLMRENADDIVKGMLLLAHILHQPEQLLIGIEDNKPEAIAALRKATEGTSINVVTFPTKYPSGGEKQLIEILTGKQVPSGGIPAQIGIVVQNVGTAVAAYRAVRFGEPLISRVTTVVGQSLQTQQNIHVLVGTPIDYILEQHGWNSAECPRLVIGGPMMGFTVESTQLPVTKTTNCILAASHAEMPEQPLAQPCIRCGMCAEACPVSLLPQQMLWYAQSENHDQLRAQNLFDCIECGACSFVCPSNIPLVQYYRAAKGNIRKLDADKEKSDRSRQRFEARKARVEKAEAEKEAKRLARKAAAEKAKQMQSVQKGTDAKDTTATSSPAIQTAPSGGSSSADALVAAAVSRAQNNIQDPDKEKAKLQRGISGAEGRVDRATQQLQKAEAENADSTRLDSLRARLKEAEQKARQAKAKLEQFEEKQNVSGTSAASAGPDANEKAKQTIASLEKRLGTAKQKLKEAQAEQSPSIVALQSGVNKLQEKLTAAQQALENSTPDASSSSSREAPVKDAAEAAIERAKAKAAALAEMTPEEKAAQQIKSLENRLNKARERLEKAKADNSDNIEAFQTGVDKLEAKLAQAKEAIEG